MSADDAASAEFMHALGYLYLRNGQHSRSLVFLLLAFRIEPDDPGILRTLAAAFVANGAGDRALGVLERLREVEGGPSVAGTLLRARALWAVGDHGAARRCFRTFVEMRKES